MIIDAVADLHGHFPKLDGGDLLIVAGDLTARDKLNEYAIFMEWLENQKYSRKILIAGNHDNEIQNGLDFDFPNSGIEYLCNSGTEFEGLKIWGTPYSLMFDGVNPRCTAFMGTEEELQEKYDMIPNDIDILISHSPPFGILDETYRNEHVGSKSLLKAMLRVKPRIIIFGHIHEQGGKSIDLLNTFCVNASYVNERYKPINQIVRLEIQIIEETK